MPTGNISYNPIVRTFCQVRAVLVGTLGVDRCEVCPATRLDALIPPGRLPEVLARLREADLPTPPLERQFLDYPLAWLAIVGVPLALLAALASRSWLVALGCVFLACTLIRVACCVTLLRTVPRGMLTPAHHSANVMTVGDLVIFLTRFSDHRGYRFSRNEIALKTRLVIADWLGLPIDEVREDSRFIDLTEG